MRAISNDRGKWLRSHQGQGDMPGSFARKAARIALFLQVFARGCMTTALASHGLRKPRRRPRGSSRPQGPRRALRLVRRWARGPRGPAEACRGPKGRSGDTKTKVGERLASAAWLLESRGFARTTALPSAARMTSSRTAWAWLAAQSYADKPPSTGFWPCRACQAFGVRAGDLDFGLSAESAKPCLE